MTLKRILKGMALLIAATMVGLLIATAATAAPTRHVTDRGYRTFSGVASEYGRGDGFHGRRTASGERFNMWRYTCASRSLPFGTQLRVTNTRNGRSTIVTVTDRGPFVHGRILDLAHAAARHIGLDGIGHVRVEVLSKGRVRTR